MTVTGYTVAVANSPRVRRRDVDGAGRLAARRACSTSCMIAHDAEAPVPARCCRPCSRASTSRQPERGDPARRRSRDQRRPAIHDVRRRRSDRRAAGDDPRAARRRCACWSLLAMSTLGAKIAAARAVGELARRAGRGGGTSLPGKVLIRLEPHAIARARRPARARARVVISATNGKTTTRRDGRLGARARRASRSSTTAPARTWPAASPRRCSRAARPGGRIDGELGLFEVDEFWLDRIVPELEPRAIAARQPVPRPARPLRRARDDRRPLGRGVVAALARRERQASWS